MEDKLINILIALIVIVVIVLGLFYFYEITGSLDVINTIGNMLDMETSEENTITYMGTNEETEENTSSAERNTISITTSAEEVTSSETTSTNNNRYYYNQLDSYSKVIYDAVADNISNLKSGNYTININYDFSELLSSSDGEEKLNDYYSDAINAINLDVSDLFYIDFSKMYLNIETTTTLFSTKYKLYLSAGENSNYYSDGFSSRAQVENAIIAINNIKEEVCNLGTVNDYSKIKTIHDWIIENVEYVYDSENRSNIYGTLVEKEAVCEGYARAYKYLLDELGVTNILVIGTATNSSGETEDHMWNYVCLNGTWYAVDVTWDDPIVTGGGTANYETKHKYFLVRKFGFFYKSCGKE